MISKTTFLVVVLVKAITSQRIMPPYNYPLYSETVVERYSSPTQYPPLPAENDVVCKNLATAIQNVIFDKFSQNCFRTPVFGPLSGPLVNEIKSSVCNCPLCSSYNVSPNGYSKSLVSPSAVSKVLRSSVPNVVPNCRNPTVSVNRNYDLMTFLKSLSTCDCGCRGSVIV